MNEPSTPPPLSPSTPPSSLPEVSPDPQANELPLSPDWDYETTVAQIESIIARIEMGELSLAEVFDQFAIAVDHLRDCEAFLNHHRQQVDLLIETLTDGGD